MAQATNALDVLMGREYEEDARQAFADSPTDLSFNQTVGFEMEYSVVKAGGTELVGQQVRDAIVAQDAELMEQELGQWQLEVKGQPIDLAAGGFGALEAHVKECEGRAASAARQYDAELIRIGCFPLQPLDQIHRSDAPRYEQVVSFHDENHSDAVPTSIGASETTRPATAEVIGVMNSVQFNMATRSGEEAVRLLNISLHLIPQVVAVSGNSKYVDGIDTGYHDTRMLLWERTHDTRTAIEIITKAPQRVGLPDKYFRNIEDYNNFVRTFPFILHKPGNALRVGTGLIWTDARLKPRDGKILLEFRPISMQPSVEEDVAVCAFYVGLLEYYRAEERRLPPLALVKKNRFMAMRYGLEAVFTEVEGKAARHVPARQVVEEGLEKARLGLTAAGFEGGVDRLEILRARLRDMRTPSDKFAARVERAKQEGLSLDEALRKAVRGCAVVDWR